MTISGWLRYGIVRRLLPPDVERVLEIGAGRGSFGSLIAPEIEYLGLEPDPASFRQAQRLINPWGTVLPIREEDFADGKFDAVCAFEVLEHIEDDGAALARWKRHLRPGGWLILSVPAGRRHFGSSDVRVGHYRRYDEGDIRTVLERSGFDEVDVRRYGFPLGYILLVAWRILARRGALASMGERTASSGRWLQPAERSAALRRLVAAPFVWIQRPFEKTSLGTGLVVRARHQPIP